MPPDFVRSATVSLVGVTLAIHLADAGWSAAQIGLLYGESLFSLNGPVMNDRAQQMSKLQDAWESVFLPAA